MRCSLLCQIDYQKVSVLKTHPAMAVSSRGRLTHGAHLAITQPPHHLMLYTMHKHGDVGPPILLTMRCIRSSHWSLRSLALYRRICCCASVCSARWRHIEFGAALPGDISQHAFLLLPVSFRVSHGRQRGARGRRMATSAAAAMQPDSVNQVAA